MHSDWAKLAAICVVLLFDLAIFCVAVAFIGAILGGGTHKKKGQR